MKNLKILCLLIFCLFSMIEAVCQNFDQLNLQELDSIGMYYYEQGDYNNGLSYLLESLERTKKLGIDSSHVVSLNNLALLYTQMEHDNKAERLYLEALDISTQIWGKQHTEYLCGLNGLGVLYDYMGNYEKAATAYNEVINICESNQDTTNGQYLLSLGNSALLYSVLGEYEKSKKRFAKTIRLKKVVEGDPYTGQGIDLGNLALLYNDLGDFQKAIAIQKEGLKTLKVQGLTNHPNYPLGLNNLAVYYGYLGLLEEAEQLHLSALEIQKRILGNRNEEYAYSLNGLGQLYSQQERYEQAEQMYLETISIWKETLGPEHSDYSIVLINLAQLYENIGFWEKAIPLYQQSLDILKNKLGTNHVDYALVLGNIGALLLNSGRYPEAESKLLEARKIWEKNELRNHPDYIICLGSLAQVYSFLKKNEQAENLYLKIIEIRKKILGTEHPDYIVSLNDLANHYAATASYEAAKLYYHKAIKYNLADKKEFSGQLRELPQRKFYSQKQILHTLEGLQEFYYNQYQKSKATPLLQEVYSILQTAIKINESYRNGFSTEKDKLRSLRQTVSLVQDIIKVGLALDSLPTEPEKNIPAELFSYAEQNKSVLLTGALQAEQAYRLSDLPDSLNLKEQRLQKDLGSLQKKILETSDQKERQELKSELTELTLEIDRFKKQLEATFPKYFNLKYASTTANVSDIQKYIDSKTLVLEYFVSDSLIYLFSIGKTNLKIYSLNSNKKELTNRVQQLRQALSDYEFIQNNPDAFQLYTQNAYWFYQQFIASAIDDNGDINKLIIIPDHELGHLPFGAFLTEIPSQKEEYKDLHYLLNDYNISYNYSATLWKENLDNPVQHTNGKVLACASSYGGITDSIIENQRGLYLGSLRKHLQPLPAAQKEVEALSEFFQGDFMFGDSVNEAFFKQNAQNYGIIHLAMHGLLHKRVPILSSLAFTENRDSLEDNFLQAYEISHLKLNAQLVVLSACETGYGKFEQGEGVMSLARSFMYAGVPSLVVSLWQVNDASTSQIMQSFYKNLATGMEKDEALRQAKLNYIQAQEGLAAHPAYWSPFIQLGDSRAVKIERKGGWTWWALGFLMIASGLVALLWKRRKSKLAKTENPLIKF